MKITKELCILNGMYEEESLIKKRPYKIYVYRSRDDGFHILSNVTIFKDGQTLLEFHPVFNPMKANDYFRLFDPDIEKVISVLNAMGYSEIASKIKLS